MKQVLFFLSIFIIFGCSHDNNQNSAAFDQHNPNPETVQLKGFGLEVMKKDLGNMNWYEATETCDNLGDGWRLPTMDEWNIIYENQEKIGGFADGKYWSSDYVSSTRAYSKNFTNRKRANMSKKDKNYVRAVRHD